MRAPRFEAWGRKDYLVARTEAWKLGDPGFTSFSITGVLCYPR